MLGASPLVGRRLLGLRLLLCQLAQERVALRQGLGQRIGQVVRHRPQFIVRRLQHERVDVGLPRALRPVAAPCPDTLPVDPVEQHGQLGRGQPNSRLMRISPDRDHLFQLMPTRSFT
jgi:hypothetical protein